MVLILAGVVVDVDVVFGDIGAGVAFDAVANAATAAAVFFSLTFAAAFSPLRPCQVTA